MTRPSPGNDFYLMAEELGPDLYQEFDLFALLEKVGAPKVVAKREATEMYNQGLLLWDRSGTTAHLSTKARGIIKRQRANAETEYRMRYLDELYCKVDGRVGLFVSALEVPGDYSVIDPKIRIPAWVAYLCERGILRSHGGGDQPLMICMTAMGIEEVERALQEVEPVSRWRMVFSFLNNQTVGAVVGVSLAGLIATAFFTVIGGIGIYLLGILTGIVASVGFLIWFSSIRPD